VLAAAPSPDRCRRLSQSRIETLLRKASRQRNIAATAAPIRTELACDQLTARPGVVSAYAASASALVAVLNGDGGTDRGGGRAGGAGLRPAPGR
jgi:hypothetical protein